MENFLDLLTTKEQADIAMVLNRCGEYPEEGYEALRAWAVGKSTNPLFKKLFANGLRYEKVFTPSKKVKEEASKAVYSNCNIVGDLEDLLWKVTSRAGGQKLSDNGYSWVKDPETVYDPITYSTKNKMHILFNYLVKYFPKTLEAHKSVVPVFFVTKRESGKYVYACGSDAITKKELRERYGKEYCITEIGLSWKRTKIVSFLYGAGLIPDDEYEVINQTYDAIQKEITAQSGSRTIVFSIHPLDYIAMSNCANGWASCYDILNGGSYGASAIAVMQGYSTMIAYEKGGKDIDLFAGIKTHAQRWRATLILEAPECLNEYGSNRVQGTNMVIGANYPFECSTRTEQVKDTYLELLSSVGTEKELIEAAVLKSISNDSSDVIVSSRIAYNDYRHGAELSLVSFYEAHGQEFQLDNGLECPVCKLLRTADDYECEDVVLPCLSCAP